MSLFGKHKAKITLACCKSHQTFFRLSECSLPRHLIQEFFGHLLLGELNN